MILRLYGILDEKAQAFVKMQFFQTDGIATRQFSDAVRDPKTFLNQHPEDYSIYVLGEIDDETGLVSPIVPPILITRASAFVNDVPINLNGKECAK